MNKPNKNDYIKQLSKRMFWDTDISILDYKKNRQTIIERIAVYGTENDERIMNIVYPARIIKKCLMASDSLTEKVITYYAYMLRVKESKFKCYAKTPVQMSF